MPWLTSSCTRLGGSLATNFPLTFRPVDPNPFPPRVTRRLRENAATTASKGSSTGSCLGMTCGVQQLESQQLFRVRRVVNTRLAALARKRLKQLAADGELVVRDLEMVRGQILVERFRQIQPDRDADHQADRG